MYFIQAYQDKNEWWRYILTMAITAFAYFVLGSIPLTLAIIFKTIHNGPVDLDAFSETYDTSVLGLDQNVGLIMLLIPSILSVVALFLAMIYIHGKKPGRIASAAGRVRWGRLFGSAFVWLILLIAIELFFAFRDPENYSFQWDREHFLPLVIIALMLIPFQALSEELFFRSYLMQGLGLWWNSRVFPLIITSILFGLMHIMNPEVKEFGYLGTMPYYIGFGFFAGLLVIFDDGIEMACGVHAVNNIYSTIFVSYNASALHTAALWKIKDLDPYAMTIAFSLTAIFFLIIMSKIFRWKRPVNLFKPISDTLQEI